MLFIAFMLFIEFMLFIAFIAFIEFMLFIEFIEFIEFMLFIEFIEPWRAKPPLGGVGTSSFGLKPQAAKVIQMLATAAG